MEKNSDMVEPHVVLKDVCKTFRAESGAEVKAVEAVNMTVAPGEFVVILGPTGCGKTTILNLVAGLETPDSGGITVRSTKRSGAIVPCVFQHYTLFPWRNVLSNTLFGLQMAGVRRREREQKSLALLEQVGLHAFAHAYPHELSGGMRQRAAIAQALALDPELLVMDEPFGALDDHTRRELSETLMEIWARRRMTILFVTHSIDEALLLGDRIVVFKGHPGRNTQEFPVALPRPRDRFSAEFTTLHLELRRCLSDPGLQKDQISPAAIRH